jgi:hypothetical protein
VLRHAGYPTEGIVPRVLSVEDLSWADLVVTVSGEAEDWQRFLPRSMSHQHEAVDDPVSIAQALVGSQDEDEPFRSVLRTLERIVLLMRPPRSSRMPVAAQASTFAGAAPPPFSGAARPSRGKLPALAARPTPLVEEPWAPSSTKIRTPR